MRSSAVLLSLLPRLPLLLSLLPCLPLLLSLLLQLRVLCEGVVSTVGRLSVGDWKVPFTAHPKLDSTTGM
jgi:hypothetical protein